MLPIIIAKNQTIGDIYLDNVGLIIPGSGEITLTDFAHFYEIAADSNLNQAVVDGDVIINDGTSDLTLEESLAYLDCTGNLNGPVGTLASNTILILKDTSGRYADATGVTIDSSDNLDVPGDVTAANIYATGDGLKISDSDDTNWLTISTSSNLTADRTFNIITGDSNRNLDLSGSQGSIYYVDSSGNTVSLSPGTSGQFLKTQGAGANPTWDTPGGSGDVVGPASSTDNAIVRFDGTTGKLVQNSVVTISDTGVMAGLTDITIDAAATFNLGTNATAHTITVGSTTSTSAITLQTGTGAYTVNAGGIYDINATGAVTIDGPGISIDGTSASNLSVTGAGLTVSTITSGTLAVTSAGALNLSSTTGDWQATGALTIDSSGGTISIGSDADAQAINIGTGAAARTITMGNVTGATAVILNAGTGASAWNVTGAGTLSIGGSGHSGTITIGGTGSSQTIDIMNGISSGGTVNIGNTNSGITHTINIGTVGTGGVSIVNIGSALSSSSTTISSGSVDLSLIGGSDITLRRSSSSGGTLTLGGINSVTSFTTINIGTEAIATTITAGNSTGATAISLDVGTGGLNLGTNATAHTTTVGSTTSTSAITLQTGTGAYTVNAGGIYDINATGAVTIDGPGISIDGTSASNLSVTGADLTVSTITSGTLAVTSAGALNLSASSGIGISSNTSITSSYVDIASISTPSSPSVGTRRLYVDNGTGKLSVRTSAGSTVSLEETGGSGGGTIPLSITIDAVDTTISTGFKAFYPPSSISGTISSWSIMLDSVGSIEFDIWNANSITPTSVDTITASAPPIVTSAQFDSSSTLTGWSTTISTDDILGFEVVSVSEGVSRATLTLYITL